MAEWDLYICSSEEMRQRAWKEGSSRRTTTGSLCIHIIARQRPPEIMRSV